MSRMIVFARLFACLFLAVFIFTSFCHVMPLNKAFAEESEDFSVTAGDSIGAQFRTNAPIDSIGFYATKTASGKKGTVEVFKWNKNVSASYDAEPIYTGEVSGWASGTCVGAEFAEPLEAGEYILRLTITKGVNLTFALNGTDGKTASYSGIGIMKFRSFRLIINGGESSDFLDTCSEQIFDNSGIDPTQWTAVDGLGRTVPVYGDVSGKNDKLVGVFYWTWHEKYQAKKGVSLNDLIEAYPEAKNDYNHPIWEEYAVNPYCWDEPLFGYYIESDDYVLRKHAELLADAGVDFVLFDCTNVTENFHDAYMNLLKVWSQAKNEGVNVPKIGFMLPFTAKSYNQTQLVQIYNDLYKKGLYQDMWFYYEGKPMIMAIKDSLDLTDPEQKEISEFFTFRKGEPSYFLGDQSNDTWGWLHIYPQALYKRADGSVEMTTVGVAQNANYESMELDAMNGSAIMGRSFSMQKNYSYSYTYRNKTVTVNSETENAMLYGINFQEQWDYAISVDPDIIFVTGWNEWIVSRLEHWMLTDNAFPDQFTDNYSRDCEPSKGPLKDYYYYQLASNIRRFKGVSQQNVQTVSKTVDVAGSPDQWNEEGVISYNHYMNNTYDRNITKSWGKKYENHTMRNDIVKSKVLLDSDNIYFYVETAEDITPYTDENWMRLLIDTGAATEDSKDYEEFEYILNRVNPTADSMTLEKSTGGWNWETVGTVSYSVQGNVLQVAIPKAMLGITSDKPCFNFKWCDNNLTDGDIMTLYTDGDAAPGERFAFSFISDASVIKTPEPTAVRTEEGKSGGNYTVLIIICAILAAAAMVAVTVVLTKGKKKS